MPGSSPTEDVDVVPMDVTHLADVLRLGQRVFDTAVKPYTGWSLAAAVVHLDADDPACFVALHRGRVSGFVLGSMTFEQRGDWGYLEWIAVDPALRGRGLAGRLVDACRDRLLAAGAAAIVTDVEAGNRASSALMERHGFAVRATVNLYVHPAREDGTRLTSSQHFSSARRTAAIEQAEARERGSWET